MIRAFQWDLARQVERLDWLLAQLPSYARWGYQELHLHLEDAVDYPSLPGVARRDAYSWKQFKQLVSAATDCGIKVVPIANLLGHTQYLIKTDPWRDLNELRGSDGAALPVGQICPSHPQALAVAEKLVTDLAPLCTAGKIHFGLDESFHLGKHPRSRREIEKVGLASYFAQWVNQLHRLAKSHGLETAIWADMLILLPEAIPQLPAGIMAYDWYYHAFRRHPRFELYNFAEYNLAPALAAQGIEYWGCPMNGAFRHEPLPVFGERLANAVSWWNRCKRTGAHGFLVSSWEANHLTPEMTTIVDAAIAGLWLEGDATDASTLLRRGFERVHGSKNAASQAHLALACDDRAFAGYARAERNEFWDTAHGDGGSARAAAETRFFKRAIERKISEPLKRSLVWRLYLSEREHFVRASSDDVLKARRLWQRKKRTKLKDLFARMQKATRAFEQQIIRGKQAASALNDLTRKRNVCSANHRIIDADQQKLKAWKRWLSAVVRNPEKLLEASPIAGRWQLCLTVHATRPAANAVVIQQQNESGEWIDLRQRHTIEFRSLSAQPRSQIKRPWSVPIAYVELPLRIALRGVGEVAISQVKLTDGLVTRSNRSWRIATRKRLGTTAPACGWLNLEWTKNNAELALDFDTAKD
ncbi:MAG: family 20 glycosylhydrolase [Opitutaceae bacterium]|nr:family 20 glycosylhydrolase [Opitutaceae bacterium]